MSYDGEERRKSSLDLNDRLIVVETRLDNLEDIRDTLRKLNDELTKYKGMVGGILWVGTSLMTILVLFKEEIMRMFGR